MNAFLSCHPGVAQSEKREREGKQRGRRGWTVRRTNACLTGQRALAEEQGRVYLLVHHFLVGAVRAGLEEARVVEFSY